MEILILVVLFILVRQRLQLVVLFIAERLLYELPQMQWMTIEDVLERGYSRLLSSLALHVLHANNMLEVKTRTDSDVPPDITFAAHTIQYFQFRIHNRHGGKGGGGSSPRNERNWADEWGEPAHAYSPSTPS